MVWHATLWLEQKSVYGSLMVIAQEGKWADQSLGTSIEIQSMTICQRY